MYNSIHLNAESQKDYIVFKTNKELCNLSKINVLVGPNNSGKSRFLRSLFTNTNVEFKINDVDLENLNLLTSEIKSKIDAFFVKNGVVSADGLNYKILKNLNFISTKTEDLSELNSFIKFLENPRIESASLQSGRINIHQLNNYIRDIGKEYFPKFNFIKTFNIEDHKFHNIYVPTLRGLRGVYLDSKGDIVMAGGRDNYLKRTYSDYFQRSNVPIESIYTGLSLYEDVKKLLLGNHRQRARIRKFEKFIGETFFNNSTVSIIPHIDDNVVHIKIGEEEDYPIYKLGEGVQSIIILTYPLFFNEGKKLSVFYEEPDIFLHPGFQRIFIETLSKQEFKDHQFFLTTHSNHFLDMTLDFNYISVFAFKKNTDSTFVVENVKSADSNLLQILGVRDSSVFLTNCTVWIEGISDRIYIRKYLELYQESESNLKKFHEDIHYSYVEYAGGNITHWSFLEDSDEKHPNINVERLCAKLFLITDKDGEGLKKNGKASKKALRHDELTKTLKERYYCLQSREIENLLTEKIIIEIIKSLEANECTEIDFSKIKRSKYKEKYLGEFIDANISGLTKNYAADSGTIKNKVDFSKKAVEHLAHFNDLSDEAKELTKKIYAFIELNNK